LLSVKTKTYVTRHLSWQQYVTAVILIAAAWYAYVALRFNLVKFNKSTAACPMPAAASSRVIGAIKPDEGTAVQGDELVFSISTPDDVSEATIPKGPADDFLAEAQTLADAADSKCEFLSLLKILIMRYENDHLDLSSLYPNSFYHSQLVPTNGQPIKKSAYEKVNLTIGAVLSPSPALPRMGTPVLTKPLPS